MLYLRFYIWNFRTHASAAERPVLVLHGHRFYRDVFQHYLGKHELSHDKTNNLHVRPEKTQVSLGIRPVWSESSLSTWRKLGALSTHWAHSELWSDWADAQADLSLRRVHRSYCWFCCVAASEQQSLKDDNQPLRTHSLISAFVVRCLDCVKSKVLHLKFQDSRFCSWGGRF